MATTQYQVLARYYNRHTNNPITNKDENAYQKAFGFYTGDASSEIADIMMEGNNPQNVKTDMLFAYAGTKKVYPTDGSVEAAASGDPDAKFSAEYKWPYMIVDVYERVWFSPWFSVHVCGSLKSALEKAKVVVSAVGIDNVKIIKLVSIDQFIKLR